MTLIVGIKCKDSIVLGADGAATLTSFTEGTVIQKVRKLDIILDCIVFGSSGPIGLGQRYRGEIESIWKSRRLVNKLPHEVMDILRRELWKYAEVEWKCAETCRPVIGGAAAMAAMCLAIVAIPISGFPHLFQFNHQCSPEEATTDLPFVSIGSGQKIADPFLAFIRHIFWSDKPPNLSEGVFATLWTLAHAIRTNPAGVADPIQIVTLSKNGKSKEFQAHELSRDELQEHGVAIKMAEDSLKNFRNSLKETGQPEIKLPTQ